MLVGALLVVWSSVDLFAPDEVMTGRVWNMDDWWLQLKGSQLEQTESLAPELELVCLMTCEETTPFYYPTWALASTPSVPKCKTLLHSNLKCKSKKRLMFCYRGSNFLREDCFVLRLFASWPLAWRLFFLLDNPNVRESRAFRTGRLHYKEHSCVVTQCIGQIFGPDT